MATVGEVKAVWTAAKAAVGGIGAINREGRVELVDDQVVVYGDGELVIADIPLAVEEMVAVSGRDFDRILKAANTADQVEVAVNREECAGTINGIGFLTMNPDDSPEWIIYPMAEEYGPYRGDTVKGVAAFTGDKMRPILSGVAFRRNEVVATDAYRLCREKVRADNLPGEDAVVIPGRPLAAIGGRSKTVMVSSDGEQAQVSGEVRGFPVRWRGPAIAGKYPDYGILFPESWRVEAGFYPDRGVEGVRSVDAALDKGRPAKLSLNGTMEVSAEEVYGVSVPPVAIAGPVRWTGDTEREEMVVGVQARHLAEAVKYLDDGGGIMYRALSPSRPMLLSRKPMDGRGEREVLVMPIKLDD